MKSGTAMGYSGKMAESADPSTKFLRLQPFTPEEAKSIIDGIEVNLNPTENLSEDFHGAKKGVAKSDNTGYVLPKGEMAVKWIYDRVNPMIKTANRTWNFDIQGFENLHMMRYGISPNTEWLMDGFDIETVRRKLSIHIMLSDPKDYKGGDLEFMVKGEKSIVPQMRQGEMIIFPSFMTNRITSIKQGARYSLVSWVNGTRGWF